MRLQKIVLLTSLVLSTLSAHATDLESLLYVQADSRKSAELDARTRFDQNKAWFAQQGDLQKELATCTSGHGVFDPGLKIPTPDSPIARAVCDALSADDRYKKRPGYRESCEFIEYTPCRFQVTKTIFFQNPGKITNDNDWGTSTPLPINVVLPATDLAFVSVYCEQVAVLGIAPRWLCGGGSDWTWSINMWTRMGRYHPPFEAVDDAFEEIILGEVNLTEVLQKVLSASGVVQP